MTELMHIGIGEPPIHVELRSGQTCEQCAARLREKHNELQKNFEENWAGVGFMSVPGGASVARLGGARGEGLTPSQSQKVFDGNLDSYRSSKQGGLQPDHSSKAGVESMEKRVEANARVMDQHRKGDLVLGDTLKNTIGRDFI